MFLELLKQSLIKPFHCEFEELEAVPTSAAIDAPLEPPPASTVISDTPNESLANYFGGAASIGSVSSPPMVGRAQPSTKSVASSHVPLIIPSAASAHQIPPPLGGSSAPPLPLQDTNAYPSYSTKLLTPAFFAPPSSSSTSLAPPVSSMMPTALPLHPTSASAQHPQYGHGTPLLQPFPPPAPPPSFAPAHNDGPVISRDKVKDALQRLFRVTSSSI